MAPTPLNARDMAASLALGLVVPAQASEAPRVEPIIVVTGERSNQVALDRVPTSIGCCQSCANSSLEDAARALRATLSWQAIATRPVRLSGVL